MPLIERYDTPGGIEDFERDTPPDVEFRAAWEEQVRLMVAGLDNIDNASLAPFPQQQLEPTPDGNLVSDPASATSSDRAQIMRARSGSTPGARLGLDPEPAVEPPPAWIDDPLQEDAEKIVTRSLSWIAFPRALLPARRRDDRERAFADAEADRMGEQNEYFEWRTIRRPADNKIVKVVFVSETPGYWRLLAETSPATRERLVELYRELVSPEVAEADLFVEVDDGAGGRRTVYNDFNRWNTTDGIVHYIVPINSVSIAVQQLARPGALGPQPIDAYADTGPTPPMSVDNYIPRDVGALVRNGYRVTVADPVGLYIDGWDDTGWTKPDGSPVGNYWRITRGRPGAALRVEYEVPEDVEESEGFVVGDIRIGGRPITYGGQIADHMTVALPVLVCKGRS